MYFQNNKEPRSIGKFIRNRNIIINIYTNRNLRKNRIAHYKNSDNISVVATEGFTHVGRTQLISYIINW